MSWLERVLLRRWAVGALAAVACLIVVILVWVGWVAVRQWQQSLLLLADRQADDASERFVVDLTRDMQAVQRLVLLSPALDAFTSHENLAVARDASAARSPVTLSGLHRIHRRDRSVKRAADPTIGLGPDPNAKWEHGVWSSTAGGQGILAKCSGWRLPSARTSA